MTDLIDRADSGEIPHIDDLGTQATRDLSAHRRRDTTSEHTQNLAHEMAGLPPRRRPAADETVTKMRLIEPALGLNHHDMARVIDVDDTVTFGLAGPQIPPTPDPVPPPPPPTPSSLDPETGVNIFGGLGEHLPERELPLRRSVPYVMPDDRAPWTGPRHANKRRLSPWWALAGAAVVGLAMWAGLILAAVAVFL